MVSVAEYREMQMRSGGVTGASDISYYTTLCNILTRFAVISFQMAAKHGDPVTACVSNAVAVSAVPRRPGYVSVSYRVDR